jgi:hypothetical protein
MRGPPIAFFVPDCSNMINFLAMFGPCMKEVGVAVSLFEQVPLCSLLPSDIFHLQQVIYFLLRPFHAFQVA